MTQQFSIDFADIIRETQTAILEHTVCSVCTSDLTFYNQALFRTFLTQGYDIVYKTIDKEGRLSHYLACGTLRVRVVPWQARQGYQYWVFQTIGEYHRAVRCAQYMSNAFEYIGNYALGHPDPEYMEAQFVHIESGVHFSFIWRLIYVFPDLWKNK